jgi:hypothetical protein
MTAKTPKLVNRVVDSLFVRVSRNQNPSDWLQERIKVWREHRIKRYADHDLEPLLEEIEGLGTFQVMNGKNRYEFALVNPEIMSIRIWNPDRWKRAIGNQTGQLMLEYRSKFLQFCGVDAASSLLEQVVKVFCGEPLLHKGIAPKNEEFNRISRIDLACDVQLSRGLKEPDLEWHTCRARKRQGYFDPWSEQLEDTIKQYQKREAKPTGKPGRTPRPHLDNKGGDDPLEMPVCRLVQGKKASQITLREALAAMGIDPSAAVVTGVISSAQKGLQTVYFGRFGSELYGRRYDKLASLQVQDKAYMRDVWLANGWDGESPVWRTEFSLSGDLLKAWTIRGGTHDLRDIGLTLAALPELWAYLTCEWLVERQKQRKKPDRKRLGELPSSEAWQVVQNAWVKPVEAATREKPKPRPIYEQLIKQVQGCIKSVLAMASSPAHARFVAKIIKGDEVIDPVQNVFADLMMDVLKPESQAEIAKRQAKFGLDAYSDTVVTALMRRESIELWGSS